jgi:hypothetical protein
MLDINRTKDFLSVPENEVKYHITVYGKLYGIPPLVSFRRKKTKQNEEFQYKRKDVKCPHCSAKFTEASADARIDIRTNPNQQPTPSLFYHKCEICSNEIGINPVVVA